MANIIIVEDEAVVAMESKMNLISAGYGVLAVVSSAAEAIYKTEEQQPDLVLMDIILKGGVNGIEAAREIRKRSSVPILFITGSSDMRTRSQVSEVTHSSLLLKPILTNDLIAAIERILKQEGNKQ